MPDDNAHAADDARKLRARFPRWGILFDPLESVWVAVRGKRTLVAASSPEKLTEQVEAAARGEAGPDEGDKTQRWRVLRQLGRASYTADVASSGVLSSRPAGASSGAGSPAPATAVPGAVGVCARPGGRAVVQRSVHDLASLQYQRMSAHAWPPSGTSRPSGSAMPHMEHWAASSGRSRSRRVAAGGSASARRGPAGRCTGPVPGDSARTDEACGAMIPPCRTRVTRPPVLCTKPGMAAGDVDRQARSCQARSWWAARSYQARSWLAKPAHTKPAHPR